MSVEVEQDEVGLAGADHGASVPPAVPPPGPVRHRHHGRIVVAVVAVVVLGLGGLVVFAVHAGRVHEVEVQDAIDRYRADATDSAGDAAQVGPAAGVYRISGTGTEKLSLQATVRPMGPSMPATVTRDGDDCWRFRIEFHNDHWQEWHSCARAGDLLDLGGRVHQRFDFGAFSYDSDTSTACDPPSVVLPAGAAPGDTWRQACSIGEGGVTHEEGPATFVGEETVSVGGVDVVTAHLHSERTLSGDQTGHTENDTWFARDTRLPVRAEWSMRVESPAPVGGTVTYEEQGSWLMDSLTPER